MAIEERPDRGEPERRRGMRVRPATALELLGWDAMTVARRRGHVYQSRAWAAHLGARGWEPRFLVVEGDGPPFGVVSFERRWPVVPGRSSYLIRGPVPTDDEPAVTAARLALVADHLAEAGVDVVASDTELPAASGYPALLTAAGFHAIPEIQPSRHRMRVPLGPAGDEEAAFGALGKSTRQRIRAAERGGLVVVRHDTLASEAPLPGLVPAGPATSDAALDRFYDLLRATGDRRGFTFGTRDDFVPWWRAALADGLLVLLEAHADGDPIAGLVLYRHGGRLSTVHSADRAETRSAHPGALHLLRWTALRLALAEDANELDLGGVDVPGARRVPREGEPMWGLYEHKRAFGAEWVELSGAYERVADPVGYRAGSLAAGVLRRLRPRTGTGSAG